MTALARCVVRSYDAEDGAAPLYFTEKAKLSRFFSGMRPEVCPFAQPARRVPSRDPFMLACCVQPGLRRGLRGTDRIVCMEPHRAAVPHVRLTDLAHVAGRGRPGGQALRA